MTRHHDHHPTPPDRRTVITIAAVLALVGAALALATWLAGPANADPTWTTYNSDTCTITITPSGRSVFQVTIGGATTTYDLADHQPITLDVDGQAWSVAVERDTAGGWVIVASGDAITCDTTTTTAPPTTTVPPSSTTTTPPSSTTTPPPDTTTTSFLNGCDNVECPEPPPTTRPPRDTTTTTGAPAPPPSTEPPSSSGGPTDDTLPVTGAGEQLRDYAIFGALLVLTGGGIALAEMRSRKAGR